jgi:hypothetical protein
MITKEYNDLEYIDSIKKYVDYQNVKNIFFSGVTLGLFITNYLDYKAV